MKNMVNFIFGIAISPFVVIFWIVFASLLSVLSVIFSFINVKEEIDIDKLERNTDFSVCGTLFSKGILSEEEFNFEKGVSLSVDNTTYIGYVYFFFPIILFLQNFDSYDKLARYLVVERWMKKVKNDKSVSDFFSVKHVRLIGEMIVKLKNIYLNLCSKGFFNILSVTLPITMAVIIVSGEYENFNYYYPIVSILILLFLESIGNDIENEFNDYSREFLALSAISFVVSYLSIIAYIIYNDVSLQNLVLIILISAPVFAGISYPISHEYLHSDSKIENFFGEMVSFLVLMPMFGLIHNNGHHVDLKNKNDIVVAKYNENVGSYLFRQILGIYKTTYRLNRRLSIKYSTQQFLIVLFLYIISPQVAFFVVVVFLSALSILELVNYIEHYSMGDEENILDRAIDTKNCVTNGVLFNVGRHSHHHKKASVKYGDLEFKSSYSLPYGYISQILMLILPRSWNYIIDRRKHIQNKTTNE